MGGSGVGLLLSIKPTPVGSYHSDFNLNQDRGGCFLKVYLSFYIQKT
jgi:hypothetical protein